MQSFSFSRNIATIFKGHVILNKKTASITYEAGNRDSPACKNSQRSGKTLFKPSFSPLKKKAQLKLQINTRFSFRPTPTYF